MTFWAFFAIFSPLIAAPVVMLVGTLLRRSPLDILVSWWWPHRPYDAARVIAEMLKANVGTWDEGYNCVKCKETGHYLRFNGMFDGTVSEVGAGLTALPSTAWTRRYAAKQWKKRKRAAIFKEQVEAQQRAALAAKDAAEKAMQLT